jgi:RNA polymerase sigma factor (sigma-70 family)
MVWRDIALNDSEAETEAVSYFWDKLLQDRQDVCNAEVRFAVYLENRVDDYMIHRLTSKNTMQSTDSMGAADEDGHEVAFIETVPDPTGVSPEQGAMQAQLSTAMMTVLVTLPTHERNAVYFRVGCDYDWKAVADLLDCSIPTARDLVNRGMTKLRGEP